MQDPLPLMVMYPPLTIICTLDQLRKITRFCREVYFRTFPPDEAERKLRNLTFVDAVLLYQEGLPDSNNV
jgi:hypothetical protein